MFQFLINGDFLNVFKEEYTKVKGIFIQHTVDIVDMAWKKSVMIIVRNNQTYWLAVDSVVKLIVIG